MRFRLLCQAWDEARFNTALKDVQFAQSLPLVVFFASDECEAVGKHSNGVANAAKGLFD